MAPSTMTSRPDGASATRQRGRYTRSTSTPRRSRPTGGLRRRRQPQPSGIAKLLGAVLPASAVKSTAKSSKTGRAGGLALAAAAAGMAFKNRDKLAQMTHRDSRPGARTPSEVNKASRPPATPVT